MTRTVSGRYDGAVATALPLVAGALAVTSAAVATAEAFRPGPHAVPLFAVPAAVAVILTVLAVLGNARPLPQRLAHPITFGIVGAVAAASLVNIVLTHDATGSIGLVLAMIVCGAVLVSPEWIVAGVAVVWGAEAAALILAWPSGWELSIAGLAAASAVAAALHVVRLRLLLALSEAYERAEAAAVRDALTGLANRRGLAMLGGQIVELARRQGDAVHCVFVDLDSFSAVNEHLGHDIGDDLLVAVADILRSVTRSTDAVARWGGDEFCIVGPGPGTAPLELERRLRERLLAAPVVPLEVWDPRVSAGGAMLAPWDAGTLDTLLGKADQEMYLRRAVRREASPLPRRRVHEQ